MMRKQAVLISIAALCFAGPAVATEAFSYSFVELGWVKQTLDDLDVDADGPGARVSVELTPAFHLFGSYSEQDLDLGSGSDVNGESLALGAGHAWSLSSKLDLVANVAYLRDELEIQGFGGSGSMEVDGYGVAGYVRMRPVNQLELTGGLSYTDFDELGDDTFFTAGARFFFTQMFAVGVDVSLNSDSTAYILGGRFNFGGR
jgi:hypothetical protein